MTNENSARAVAAEIVNEIDADVPHDDASLTKWREWRETATDLIESALKARDLSSSQRGGAGREPYEHGDAPTAVEELERDLEQERKHVLRLETELNRLKAESQRGAAEERGRIVGLLRTKIERLRAEAENVAFAGARSHILALVDGYVGLIRSIEDDSQAPPQPAPASTGEGDEKDE